MLIDLNNYSENGLPTKIQYNPNQNYMIIFHILQEKLKLIGKYKRPNIVIAIMKIKYNHA